MLITSMPKDKWGIYYKMSLQMNLVFFLRKKSYIDTFLNIIFFLWAKIVLITVFQVIINNE